ncbi:L,D-transpeptidase [Lusitaniella coriacea LEGE 07157]|uniref:L,D-transpeptidase n=1 Tax=Lusitaniella coriacea LEGE 07157 TaxID=945747 RepID=A0A8J7B6P5_9CYAN|nr:L,D-transpeptidase [Lusitaniella coriacea]MBE9114649.1 L,D-transpeptidase [Lusitaniella coriacea LEGE 07157]
MQHHHLHKRLRWLGTVLISTTLTLTALNIGSIPEPLFAQPSQEQISQRIAVLKNSSQRWIEINLSTQRLIAWEGGQSVYAVIISTGKPATPTRPGIFAIQDKQPSARLRGSNFDVPDVPFILYYDGGSAIHGAYWVNRFGQPVSHGSIYMAVNHARWLYNWAYVGVPAIVHH